MEEAKSQNEPRYIDVPVLKKSRRVLVFLADFFLTLMLTVTLFNLAVYPLAKQAVGYDARLTSLKAAQKARDGVLYDLSLLFPVSPTSKESSDFDNNLIYTCDEYIHALVVPTHGAQYEVFRHYYVDLRSSTSEYVALYKEIDKNHSFFDIGTDTVSLKAEYMALVAPKYNPDDTISAKGQEVYEKLQDKIFAQGYHRLLTSAYANNLSSGGVSYKAEQDKVANIANGNLLLVSTCVLLSYFLSWLPFFMIIPSVNKSRKTVGMLALKVYRVKRVDFDAPSLPITYLQGAYALLAGAGFLVFVPWGNVAFNELFALPILFIVSVISLVFALASLAMILVDVYNRSLSDFFSQCYCIGEDDYDELARKKVGGR